MLSRNEVYSAYSGPPEDSETAARELRGFLRGSVIATSGFDFTAPVLDEPLSAEDGELHA
jgi:hypothetical protein